MCVSSLVVKLPVELRMNQLLDALHHNILFRTCVHDAFIVIKIDRDITNRERLGKLNGVIPITQTRVNTGGHK